MTNKLVLKNELINTLFDYLETHEKEILSLYCQTLTFSKGKVIIRQGKPCDGMYIIASGTAKMVANILGKGSVELGVLDKLDLFGEETLIETMPSNVTLIANEKLSCLFLSKNYFSVLSKLFPSIKYKISKIVMKKICSHLTYLNKTEASETSIRSINIKESKNHLENLLHECSIHDFKFDENELEYFSNFKHPIENNYKKLFENSIIVKAPRNCILIKKNDVNSGWFFILRGAVQILLNKKNKIIKLAVLGPTSVFGSMSLINCRTSFISYLSCEKVVLLKIPHDNLINLEKNESVLWYHIHDSICKSFINLDMNITKFNIRLKNELYILKANEFSARRKTRKTAGVYTEVHDCRDRVLQQSRKFISEAYKR